MVEERQRSYASNPAPGLHEGLARFTSLNALVDHWTCVQPDRTAIAGPCPQAGWRRISWAELRQSSTCFARRLLSLGLAPGEHAGILAGGQSYVDCLVAYLGILRAGGVMVPLNPRFTETELEAAITFADCALLIADDEQRQRLEGFIGNMPAVRRVVGFLPAHDSDTCMRHPESGLAAKTTGLPEVTLDDVANLVFTSGTTAVPKGVIHSHRTALATGLIFSAALGLRNEDVFHHALPFYTSSGTQFVPMAAFWVGATLVTEPGFDAKALIDRLETEGSTAMIGVPSHYLFMLDELSRSPRDLPRIRLWDYGGAAMPPAAIEELRARFPGAELRQQYGMTESGPSGTIMLPHALQIKPGSIGTPMPHCEVMVTGADGAPVAPGQTGEIAIRSPSCMVGYYKSDEATRQTLRDGWVLTGDLGHMDADGYLYYSDRSKDIINRGGLKVSSIDVEAVLYRHPDLLEVAVVARPHDKLGEDVHAVVVSRPGASIDSSELYRFCRQYLADYKCPRQFTVVDALPKNAMGKVQKALLRNTLDSLRGGC